MAFNTMYPGINNSPFASLAHDIAATDIAFTVNDASLLPAAPNILTIGIDETAELVRYGSITGNTISDCERGFNGTTARMWAAETPVYRGFSSYDHDTFIGNIDYLYEKASILDIACSGEILLIPSGLASVGDETLVI